MARHVWVVEGLSRGEWTIWDGYEMASTKKLATKDKEYCEERDLALTRTGESPTKFRVKKYTPEGE